MSYVRIEECLKKSASIYRLVILAARRAKEVAEGSKPLIVTSKKKAASVALEEILRGKVLYKATEPEAGSKKKRLTKSKEKA